MTSFKNVYRVLCTVLIGCVAIMSYAQALKLSTNSPLTYEDVRGTPYNVSYDQRAFLINGNRVLLQGGSVHYPRQSPEMWPGIMSLAKEHGLNLIQTYIFWNYHESSPGVFDFETGNRNVTRFLQTIADAGLFVNLRIGPYVCAEWNFGGFPTWLKFEEGIEFRTDNQPWLSAMEKFVNIVIPIIEPFLARNGGPIIMAQIENEYGNVEEFYGAGGKQYVIEAANFAESLDIGVPWIMCQQADAPQQIINTCNGFYCDNWIAGHASANPTQPHMWTEDWNGWFQHWGEAVPHRPVADTAFAVTRFIMRGGSFHNYYMVQGGTNFGRWVGGPSIITSYDYDVAINEYGLPNPAKFDQLKTLHRWLTVFSQVILGEDSIPPTIPLGLQQEAISYRSGDVSVTFLANIASTDASVTWPQGSSNVYTLPAWSVSILDETGFVHFNTFSGPFNITHTTKPHHRVILKEDGPDGIEALPVVAPSSKGDSNYVCLPDVFGLWNLSTAIQAPGPLEQISTTRDTTDYLFYFTTVTLTEENIASGTADISLTNAGDFMQFQLQQLQPAGPPVATAVAYLTQPAGLLPSTVQFTGLNDGQFRPGTASLIVLSQTLGLLNYGPFLENLTNGITPSSSFSFNGNSLLNSETWHQVGLSGEAYGYSDYPANPAIAWHDAADCQLLFAGTSLVWFRLSLTLNITADPAGVYALDMGSMQKGQLWINGIHLGRYWLILAQGDCSPCSYAQSYDSSQCRTGCGQPSQRYYHVPREYLNTETYVNEVVFLEEYAIPLNPLAPTEVQLVRMN